MEVFVVTEALGPPLGVYTSVKRAKGRALQWHRDTAAMTEIWVSETNTGRIFLLGTFANDTWEIE